MTYITRAHLDDIFGQDNIAQWSQLDNETAAADEARITSAINYAEQYVEDRMRGRRYRIPFSGDIDVLKECMAKIAGWRLVVSRGFASDLAQAVAGHKDEADNIIEEITLGVRKLSATLAATRNPSGPVAIR